MYKIIQNMDMKKNKKTLDAQKRIMLKYCGRLFQIISLKNMYTYWRERKNADLISRGRIVPK